MRAPTHCLWAWGAGNDLKGGVSRMSPSLSERGLLSWVLGREAEDVGEEAAVMVMTNLI